MADYSKWKVTELKAELKRRGIAQTGLKLKQHFIDRLLAADAQGEAAQDAPAANDTVQEPANKTEAQKPQAESASANNDESPSHEIQPNEPEVRHTEVENGKNRDDPSTAGDEIRAGSQREAVAPEQDTVMMDATEAPAQASNSEAIDATIDAPAGTAVGQPQPEPAKGATLSSIEGFPKSHREGPARETLPAIDESSTSTPMSESIEDSRKRKRRSVTPPVTPSRLAQKKAKGEDGSPRELLQENKVERPSEPLASADVVTLAADPDKDAMEQKTTEEPALPSKPGEKHESESADAAPKEPQPDGDEVEKESAPKQSGNDARFKGLFHGIDNGQREGSPPRDAAEEDENRIVEPALHPATSSLYIRNFMRPLQPASLKNYLASLASPPGSSPDPEIIRSFYLDSIKTHCFVSLVNISAASRVRSALHDTVWPNERDRKPLWVDFVPEEKLREWISREQETESRGRGGPRWEVVYHESNDGIVASLQEVGAAGNVPSRGREMPPNVPSGPRGSRLHAERETRRDYQSHNPPPRDTRPGEGFKALDDLFMSTATKPKLYFLPVSREIANRRLDCFDELARRGNGPRRNGDDETRRYTFEDTDFFVDKGPEYGARRGRGGGRRGRGGGPGDRGDSFRGNSWRGRGY